MISHLAKSSVARSASLLLAGVMVLGGPPLEALQGHVMFVPRESPPEWLAPWLHSPVDLGVITAATLVIATIDVPGIETGLGNPPGRRRAGGVPLWFYDY